MDDLELMELFPQFLTAQAEPPTAAEAVTHALTDRERLREITALRLTEPDVAHILGDLCRAASRALRLPIGFVSIVLDEAQYVAAQHGMGEWLGQAGGTPVGWSFCEYAVVGMQAFVVEDARQHSAIRETPLATQDGLRCYAGMPIVTSRGCAVGSLCVAGPDAHVFSEADLQTLSRYATEATRRLETRRLESAA